MALLAAWLLVYLLLTEGPLTWEEAANEYWLHLTVAMALWFEGAMLLIWGSRE
jgi:hypothetical protein